MLPRAILLLLFVWSGLLAQAQSALERPFSVEELRSDLSFLRDALERIHPDLYMYTPKAEMDRFFDSLYQSIDAPMSSRVFFDRIAILHSRVRDGHTMLLPSRDIMQPSGKDAVFFPFGVAILDGRAYVVSDGSAENALPLGSEITSINGEGIAWVVDHLMARQVRDGYNQTYPAWILSHYFNSYYAFSFGRPVAFDIGFTLNGKDSSAHVRALPRDSIRYYRGIRKQENGSGVVNNDALQWSLDKALGSATIRIRTFDQGAWRKALGMSNDGFLQGVFDSLHASGVDKLILDIRDNQGGDFAPGRDLLKFLLDRPLNFLPGSPQQRNLKPAENAFKGRLFVLINGGSFSITGILASYLKETGRATFIGEESAGNRTVICGEPGTHTLPNTRLTIEISTRRFTILPRPNDGHGTMPDLPVAQLSVNSWAERTRHWSSPRSSSDWSILRIRNPESGIRAF